MIDPKIVTGLDLSDTENYSNGKLKDATTPIAKDGTLINKALLSDIRTVFTRVMKLTGIVPNNSFDTDNSSQLFDACFGTTKVPITTFYNGVTALNQPDESNIRVWKENGGKTFRLEGWIGGTACEADTYMFLLPEGYRPSKNIYIRAMTTDVNILSATVTYEAFSGKIKSQAAFVSSNGQNRHYFNASIPLD